ncbi:hypothetical protein Gorai_000078 [Gossypium raimondii]|uniref:Uncharacterized protein n=1 Tax=Gossypium raimondii TaxID=29730 RepID=A0A7J8PCK1_GOSRA|nr:hypothetical protein [Gossypium raimondii]
MGQEVHVTPRKICDFYNALYYVSYFLNNTDLTHFKNIDMDTIVNYLINGRGEWKHRSDALIQHHQQPEEEEEENVKDEEDNEDKEEEEEEDDTEHDDDHDYDATF